MTEGTPRFKGLLRWREAPNGTDNTDALAILVAHTDSGYSFTTTGPKTKGWRDAHAIKAPRENSKRKAYQSKWPS